MLDTVKVQYHLELTYEDLLDGWILHFEEAPDGTRFRQYYYRKVSIQENAKAYLNYYPPNNHYPRPLLSIECSLPTVLFGTNIYMLTSEQDIKDAAKVVNHCLHNHSGIPKVDLMDGELGRLDLCYNHMVGESVVDYVKVISTLEMSQRDRTIINHETVYFKSQVVTTVFYDKHKQCLLPDAKGILRQETRFTKNHYLSKKTNIPDTKLHDITLDWVEMQLQSDLHRLQLDTNIICDRQQVLDSLRAIYPVTKANRLYGFWNAANELTQDQIEKSYSPSTRKRYKRELRNAGIFGTFIKDKVCLAPLEIDFEGFKNDPEVLSVT